MKKFELTTESITFLGRTLFRIKALISFGNVKAGELGGYIEKEGNLSHEGDAWVCDNARVYGDAWVCGDARVYGDAWVCDNAWVCGDARVYGDARVCGDARVYGDAWVCDYAWVCGDARVYGDARVCGNAWVCDNARVCGNADIATISGFGSEYRTTTFFRTKNNEIAVKCGCFYGTLAEFREKVKETHGDNRYAKEYLMIADLMEMHFRGEEE